MKRKNKNRFQMLQAVLIALAAILLCILFVITGISKNVNVIEKRQTENSFPVSDYTCEEKERSSAPTGIIEEYCFTVPKNLHHDTSLSFYLAHQFVKVYLDGKCVYCLEPSGSLPMIKTPGCNWVMIPIYREDAGKDVRAVVIPAYKSVRGRTVEFLFGSKEDIIMDQLSLDWIPAAICELLILSGLIMIGYSFYYIKTYRRENELIYYGILSICMGLWHYLSMGSAPLMVPDRPVFLFYLSTGAAMLGMVSLMKSLQKKIRKNIVGVYTIVTALMCIVTVLLQLSGIADLRGFVLSVQAVGITGLSITFIMEISHQRKSAEAIVETVASFLLIIGGVLDLVLYYLSHTFANSYFLLAALLFSILVVAFYHMVNYGKQGQKLERQENQIIQSRVTAMMGQIRSHFVFNILNAISGMCKYDPEKADRTVVCFARYLRTNIDIMEEDQPVPFQTALAHLEDYVELEQIRFGEKIRFEEQIETDQFCIPPLILQPLVENSIKHGLRAKPEGGTIVLSTWMEDKNFKVCVRDDGIGFDTRCVSSKSVGIQNVRFRLKYMLDGRLEIESIPGRGTTATITLPAAAAVVQS